MNKLFHYGIRGPAYDWFRSYLTGRTQQVEISSTLSETKEIKLGVPQGSILGPLLFSIYVNDFPNSLSEGNSIMFADDTNIFVSGNNYEKLFECANSQFKNISYWLNANKLFLNVSKTKHIVFRTPNSKPPPDKLKILLNRSVIEKTSSVRFLGLVVNEHLSWKPHMDFLLQKLRISFSVVKKVSPFLNSQTLKMLYHSMIQSHIFYCITTWCNGNKTALLRLQRMANKFIRMVYNLECRASVKEIMKSNELLTIEQLAHLETACFMSRYENNTLPLAFSNFFDENLMKSDTAPGIAPYRQTRSHSKFYPTYCRINITKQSMKYKGVLIWNSVPSNLKKIKSYCVFRKKMKDRLILSENHI